MDRDPLSGDMIPSDSPQVTDFEALLVDSERWLMRRILGYASEYGYTDYTSTLEDAWRLSISGLSQSLVAFVAAKGFSAELEVHENIADDPAVAFGVSEATLHRSRGVNLQMFMSLMKYYRRSYLDMIAVQPSTDWSSVYAGAVERFFDRVEIGYCVEWSSLHEDDMLKQMQKANLEMTNEKNRYLTLFQSLEAPVFLLDSTGIVVNLNQAAAQLLGTGEGVGEGYYSGVGVGGRLDMLEEDVNALLEGDLPEFWVDREISTSRGLRHYQVRLKRMLDISGKYSGATVTLSDVTQLKTSHDHFYTLANTDALTNLLNLRGLEVAVASQKPDSNRADLLFIDLDNMKTINDEFGHHAGDEMLKAFADVITSAFRGSDIVARVGGDEFVALLFARDGEPADAALDRLDAAITARNRAGDLPCEISASVGVASSDLVDGTLNLGELLTEADARMYSNKRAKRDGDGSSDR